MQTPTVFWLLLCNEHSVDNDMTTHIKLTGFKLRIITLMYLGPAKKPAGLAECGQGGSHSNETDHDNELSTFIIGLSDLTLVIIKGEGVKCKNFFCIIINVSIKKI